MAVVLVIDNYDSFTYNLVQYLGVSGAKVEVRRNDEIDIRGIERLRPERILLSPGPCTPNEAGICLDLIRRFSGRLPIFGVCLGLQAIGQAFGGKVVRAGKVMHGKTSRIQHDGSGVFQGIPSPLTATRYHSLVVEPGGLPKDLVISATADDADGSQVIMGLRHRTHAVEGVQFHPESILTEHGMKMIANFLAA